MSGLVEKSVQFATKAHEGQFRKGGAGIPYITHPLSTMERLKRHGVTDEVTLAAAVLHDVVEDCGVTPETLVEEFGQPVADVVMEVSDPPGLGKNKAKARQEQKAPTMTLPAKLVKLSDKTDNQESVIMSPPGWSRDAIIGYAKSSKRIVDALGSVHPAMEAEFAAVYAAVLASVGE